jgi:hypothetical protein
MKWPSPKSACSEVALLALPAEGGELVVGLEVTSRTTVRTKSFFPGCGDRTDVDLAVQVCDRRADGTVRVSESVDPKEVVLARARALGRVDRCSAATKRARSVAAFTGRVPVTTTAAIRGTGTVETSCPRLRGGCHEQRA